MSTYTQRDDPGPPQSTPFLVDAWLLVLALITLAAYFWSTP